MTSNPPPLATIVPDEVDPSPQVIVAVKSPAEADEFASVKWPLDRGYPTLFVPTTAVTNDQQHTFVIRVRNDEAEWVTVQTGQTANGEIEVFGDLAAGDQVVKIATDAIHSGDALRVQTGSATH